MKDTIIKLLATTLMLSLCTTAWAEPPSPPVPLDMQITFKQAKEAVQFAPNAFKGNAGINKCINEEMVRHMHLWAPHPDPVPTMEQVTIVHFFGDVWRASLNCTTTLKASGDAGLMYFQAAATSIANQKPELREYIMQITNYMSVRYFESLPVIDEGTTRYIPRTFQ